eukprot:CFRG4967T1
MKERSVDTPERPVLDMVTRRCRISSTKPNTSIVGPKLEDVKSRNKLPQKRQSLEIQQQPCNKKRRGNVEPKIVPKLESTVDAAGPTCSPSYSSETAGPSADISVTVTDDDNEELDRFLDELEDKRIQNNTVHVLPESSTEEEEEEKKDSLYMKEKNELLKSLTLMNNWTERQRHKFFRRLPLPIATTVKTEIYSNWAFTRNLFQALPLELMHVVFDYMDLKSLVILQSTCKGLYTIIGEDLVWKEQFEKYKYTMPKCLPLGTKSWKEEFANTHSMYMRAHKNWLTGNYEVTTIRTESAGVYCVQYDDDKIVSGSRDLKIRVWNTRANPPTLTKTMSGHLGSVLCLQYDKEKIISGSSDCSVRVWDIHSGESLFALLEHSMSVLNLQFNDNALVTCSKDTTVKVWELNGIKSEPKVRLTLTGHAAPVNVVRFDDRYVISASGDSSVKVWDFNNGTLLRTLQGHTRGIACLCFNGDLAVTGSSDESIKLWNVKTGELLRTLQGHTDLVRCIAMDDRRIVSGSYDKTIRVWDIATGFSLATIKEHRHRVFKLQFDRLKMVSSSHDDCIMIWDFTCPVLPVTVVPISTPDRSSTWTVLPY